MSEERLVDAATAAAMEEAERMIEAKISELEAAVGMMRKMGEDLMRSLRLAEAAGRQNAELREEGMALIEERKAEKEKR